MRAALVTILAAMAAFFAIADERGAPLQATELGEENWLALIEIDEAIESHLWTSEYAEMATGPAPRYDGPRSADEAIVMLTEQAEHAARIAGFDAQFAADAMGPAIAGFDLNAAGRIAAYDAQFDADARAPAIAGFDADAMALRIAGHDAQFEADEQAHRLAQYGAAMRAMAYNAYPTDPSRLLDGVRIQTGAIRPMARRAVPADRPAALSGAWSALAAPAGIKALPADF